MIMRCMDLRNIKTLLSVATVAVIMMLPNVAAALPPIMPIEEIERGMVGEAYTVVDDSGLQSFRVDVVGLMDAGKGTQPMIMAKASGSLIDKVGGVLQGMSGSPVYIDGRLVGAVSAGLKEMETSTFFITPISDMLELWNLPDEKGKLTFRTVDIKKQVEENKAWREKFFKDKDKDKNNGEQANDKPSDTKKSDGKDEKANDKSLNVADAKTEGGETPVENIDTNSTDKIETKMLWRFEGFDDASLVFAKNNLPWLNNTTKLLDLPTVIANGDTVYNAYLQPGSPMGVALVYGDFSVGATGTVTAVENNRILGFGHSFLHKGNVSYFLTDASVVGTASGPTTGLKVATIGNIIGRVNQDRNAGVAGELGVFPAVVPVRVNVKDNVLARNESYGVRIAYDEDFLAKLAASVAYAAMSKTTDSLEGSTASLNFVIRTDAADGGKVERGNMFYSNADVGQIAVSELAQAMGLICGNTDRESDIVDVQVDVELERGRKTASLISAVPDKTKARPGDTVNFTTVIKPYRRDKETLVIPYIIPKRQPVGSMNLDIRGGGLQPLTILAAMQQAGIDLSPQEDKNLSTEAKLKTLTNSGKNNEIIISPSIPSGEQTQKKPSRSKRDGKSGDKPPVKLLSEKKKTEGETKFATSYIIDNVIHATLQIAK